MRGDLWKSGKGVKCWAIKFLSKSECNIGKIINIYKYNWPSGFESSLKQILGLDFLSTCKDPGRNVTVSRPALNLIDYWSIFSLQLSILITISASQNQRQDAVFSHSLVLSFVPQGPKKPPPITYPAYDDTSRTPRKTAICGELTLKMSHLMASYFYLENLWVIHVSIVCKWIILSLKKKTHPF